MAPKRAAARREPADEPIEASLPSVLIPPSEAADNQKSAYWLELVDNPAELRKAVATEDFFSLLRKFPAALWSDNRLSLYLYRRPDDEGLMIRNPEGARKYTKVLHQAIDEEYVSSKWGGGKYTLYLKLDNDSTIKECTFQIDGAPKAQPGQVVIVDGKPVSVGSSAPVAPAAPDTRSDVATIIDANSKAEEKRMDMVVEASKASIQIVRDQATAAAKPDAQSGMMDKFMTAMIDRIMNPPPVADPVETFIKLQGLIQKQNPEHEPEKEGAVEAGITLVERLTGKSVADMMKPRAAAAEGNDYGWVGPVMSTVTSLIDRLPTILHESRIARELEFRRQIYLRTAKPGEAPPPELLANNPPADNINERKPPQSATPQPGTPPDANQVAQLIVQTICHGFDTDPTMGQETAATIALLYGKQIEALGLQTFLINEAELAAYVQGIPVLAQRSKFATWPTFQQEFLYYCQDRWGSDDDGEGNIEQMPPKQMGTANPEPAA